MILVQRVTDTMERMILEEQGAFENKENLYRAIIY